MKSKNVSVHNLHFIQAALILGFFGKPYIPEDNKKICRCLEKTHLVKNRDIVK